MKGLVVDLFAGGGGASTGIEAALRRPVDIAINHSAAALAVHAANHPETTHLRGDIWSYSPLDVTRGRPVDFLWGSPTCTFFSRAKGGPLDRREALKVRSLAWVLRRWAQDPRARPRMWMVENVEAFEWWGPLLEDGKPCPKRKGTTFRRWVRELERFGYTIEWRKLAACDYGAPTTRRRIFVVGRCDGEPIAWPEPTHGRGRLPYRGAAEVIDWSIPVPSIFDRSKPLAETTLRRIARGVHRFVLSGDPYLVGGNVAATLIQRGYGERPGQAPRCMDIRQPLGTVVAGGVKHALVTAVFVAKHYGGNESPGQSLHHPLGTVTCRDHHALVVVSGYGDRRDEARALLERFPEGRAERSLFAPRIEIADIGMRWLTPRELARAQGFDESFTLDAEVDGKPLGTTEQVKLIGNSVPPNVVEALVRANVRSREARAA